MSEILSAHCLKFCQRNASLIGDWLGVSCAIVRGQDCRADRVGGEMMGPADHLCRIVKYFLRWGFQPTQIVCHDSGTGSEASNNNNEERGTLCHLISYQSKNRPPLAARQRAGTSGPLISGSMTFRLYEKYGQVRRVPLEALTSTPDLTVHGEVIRDICKPTAVPDYCALQNKATGGCSTSGQSARRMRLFRMTCYSRHRLNNWPRPTCRWTT